MITETALDELGTDELHALMVEAIRELSETNLVHKLWGRLDEILTAGGPECLPALWDDYREPGHWARDAKVAGLVAEISRLRSAVTDRDATLHSEHAAR